MVGAGQPVCPNFDWTGSLFSSGELVKERRLRIMKVPRLDFDANFVGLVYSIMPSQL